jgi:outer membrane lipoprotein SlyB
MIHQAVGQQMIDPDFTFYGNAMKFKLQTSFKTSFALVASALLLACAATGPNSPSARPVIYSTNAPTPDVLARQNTQIDDCIARAQASGLTPDEKNNDAAHRAGQGAAVGGVTAAVGALITGHGLEGVIRSGATGAAVGGTAGAVSGAVSERPSDTYRNYVHKCLSDKGLQVIGWN